jgi:hypothetical protein
MWCSANMMRILIIIAQAAAVVLLSGCAEYYYDRRDSVSFHAGDAVAANKAAQVIDPWPRGAADRSIEYNGERMQSAAERYRTNKTTPLATSATNAIYQPLGAAAPPPAAGNQ